MRNLLAVCGSFGKLPPHVLVAACKEPCQSASCHKVRVPGSIMLMLVKELGCSWAVRG